MDGWSTNPRQRLHTNEVNNLDLLFELIITEDVADWCNEHAVHLEVDCVVFVRCESLVGFVEVFLVLVVLYFIVAVNVERLVQVSTVSWSWRKHLNADFQF